MHGGLLEITLTLKPFNVKNPFKPFIAFLFNNTALTSPIYQTSERSYKISQCTKWPFI